MMRIGTMDLPQGVQNDPSHSFFATMDRSIDRITTSTVSVDINHVTWGTKIGPAYSTELSAHIS